jgi:ribose transport system substrate-binding protein
MRRIVIALFLLGLSCGTGDSGQESTGDQDSYVIGIAICMTEETPFFVSLLDGAREAADRLDVELVVVYADENCALQAQQIQQFADRGIDALLLNPVCYGDNPKCFELANAVDSAQADSIPIFTIDRSFHDTGIICHIASDNRAGGKMAGDYLAESLNRSGNIVEIRGTSGSSAALERGAGFREAISLYPGIRLVASIHADFEKAAAEELFTDFLITDSVTVDGVFAHNDDMILGAIAAADAMGRDDILFIGFDAIDDAISAIESGKLLATVAQRPAEMGRLGVETAVKYLNGEDVPDSIIVDLALILR